MVLFFVSVNAESAAIILLDRGLGLDDKLIFSSKYLTFSKAEQRTFRILQTKEKIH